MRLISRRLMEVCVLAAAVALVVSCATSGVVAAATVHAAASRSVAAAGSTAPGGSAQGGGVPGSARALAEMDDSLSKAKNASDNDHLAEAIRAYVSVLGLAARNKGPEARARADRAAAALARIGQSLTLEPGSEWVDEKGTQTASSTRSAGSASGRSPSVYLFENYGSGKSPVGDVPIRFEFVKNSGSLVGLVTTDAYGKANTTLASLVEPGSEAVIRAYPVVTSGGWTYSFSSVFRDFVYLPPVNLARVFALASSELGTDEDPQVLDSVVRALAPSGLQLSPYDGSLDPDAFRRALDGDPAALSSLGLGSELPYAAFASVSVESARQIVFDGVAYQLFTAVADIDFRLVRSDGTVVLALPINPVKGQGGTKKAAIADAYRRSSQALAAAIEVRMPDIRAALSAN